VAEWDAEIVVDQALVRALLGEQFPELDAASARPLGTGWDNSVWVVEETWAFRFPHRAVAIPGVEREIAVLPRLAPLLSAPIPEPRFVGVPSDRFGWPFFGAPLLAGEEVVEAELADGARGQLGAELGRFLRVLHDTDVDVDLPADPLGRADMSVRVPRALARLEEVDELGLWVPPQPVYAILEQASALPPVEPRAFVHGDLHFRHVLVDEGHLSGVIDWGDMCRADPAVDLLLYWCFLPPDARAAFVDAYGPIPEDRLLRARVLALFICGILLVYGRQEGFTRIEAEARAGLERTLSD
jgi:aminoglycoside phosphotransferase (APT) family kinase protein